MSEYEQLIDEIVKHGVVVKVNKIVDDNYIHYERKYVGCVVELDFSEHDKVFEDEIRVLKGRVEHYKSACFRDFWRLSKLNGENNKLKQRIAELENFSCQAEQETESLIEKLKRRIAELESKETETCEKEPVSNDCRPSMEWYDNRHQSDCIEINRLNTTIDVLIHKVEYLRQFAGLE